MRNRLWRRQHKLARARSMIAWGYPKEIALKYADNRCPCNGQCCANPRKRGELTVAEKREREAERAEAL